MTTHPIRTISRPEGKDDPTVLEYRGATLTVWRHAVRLEMAGHPYDGNASFGQPDLVMKLVDAWLDAGKIPPPYVWPPRRNVA